MRLLKTMKATNGGTVKVYRNAEWNEFVVKFYNHLGVHMDASDYHTSDKQDAYDTATVSCEGETV